MTWKQLSEEEQESANKEREYWKNKGKYWHNAIPHFDHELRAGLTKDVDTVTNFQSLELNKKLFTGIHWHNWITVSISLLNLVLLVYNIIHLK